MGSKPYEHDPHSGYGRHRAIGQTCSAPMTRVRGPQHATLRWVWPTSPVSSRHCGSTPVRRASNACSRTPLRRDIEKYERLRGALTLYRLTLGQLRQKDIIEMLAKHGANGRAVPTIDPKTARVRVEQPFICGIDPKGRTVHVLRRRPDFELR
jgi:hypothetical protein